MTHRLPLCLLAVLLTVSCAGMKSDPASNLKRLGWLVGSWKGETETAEFIETWSYGTGVRMNGRGFRVAHGDTLFAETLSIRELNGNLYYVADVPENIDEVWFEMKSITSDEVVFENLAHDFPQRFVYKHRSDGSLYVRAEGRRGGDLQVREFFYQRLE